jgi:lipoate-protein ligase A
MRLLDLTLPQPADNLALDEALLIAAEEGSGGEVLRLWELQTLAIVLGAGGSVAIDVNVAACEEDGIPIVRRSSGGGTVLLGPGSLCFSLVLAYDRAPGLDQIPLSNKYVLNHILKALQPIAPSAVLAGTSDLAIAREENVGTEPVKFSGNAQQRKRRHFLHHGTLLCGFDLTLISRYLNAPERQPPYRLDRPHGAFVANLPVQSEMLKSLLVNEWQPIEEYAPVPWELVQRLLMEKYSRDDWNRRR